MVENDPLPDLRTLKTFVIDLTERSLVAFGTGTLAGISTAQLFDLTMWSGALNGGITAVLTLLTGMTARKRGKENTASQSKSV